MRQLWTFLGMSDRLAPIRYNPSDERPDIGPLARLLLDPRGCFDVVHIVDDAPERGPDAPAYLQWLATLLRARGVRVPEFRLHDTWQPGPKRLDVPSAYEALVMALASVPADDDLDRYYNLSSGTSSMAVVLALVSQTADHAGQALFSDPMRGLEVLEVPQALRDGLRR